MNRLKILLFLLAALLLSHLFTFAQIKTTSNTLSKTQSWHLLDYQQDSVYGTSVNRAYKELLKGKKSHSVIVAVIDEGVDINHEDLQGHIWTNKREIAANGMDDDKNGYIDDVHGWNFLGGKAGKMMFATSSEADREYARLLPLYGNIKDSSNISNHLEYQYFLRAKTKHLRDSTQRANIYTMPAQFINQVASADSLLQKALNKSHVFYKDLEAFSPKDSNEIQTKSFLVEFYQKLESGNRSMPLDSIVKEGMGFLTQAKEVDLLFQQVKKDPNQSRTEIVGDNPLDIKDVNYGNDIVNAKYADHGTHVSGIIAANRNNSIGINGIADNVAIMPIRAVNAIQPGDERDKDVALAIRYAVDNGAKIINMSFGKNFSPQKQWIDEAVKYAEMKNVLLIHAASNDGSNNDSDAVYPNPRFLGSNERAKNFITVGAISIDTGLHLIAAFSNYGQTEVDVFAPGADIYSSFKANKYKSISGTSMAAPMVTGVAALLLEYYPELNAVQLKDIIMKSVTPLRSKMVYKPGTEEKVQFGALCVSGGILNAYKALQLAAKMHLTKK